jgi:hypothetical protein
MIAYQSNVIDHSRMRITGLDSGENKNNTIKLYLDCSLSDETNVEIIL